MLIVFIISLSISCICNMHKVVYPYYVKMGYNSFRINETCSNGCANYLLYFHFIPSILYLGVTRSHLITNVLLYLIFVHVGEIVKMITLHQFCIAMYLKQSRMYNVYSSTIFFYACMLSLLFVFLYLSISHCCDRVHVKWY